MHKKMLYNILSGFGGQLIILILGLILPRIMLVSYGSDVNGVTNTITQVFTYLALLQSGIGQATKNALYKPLVDNNKNDISYIMSVARSYYKKVSIYYGISVITISLVFPFIIKSDLDYFTIFMVIILEGISEVISFYFLQSLTVLLLAEGKGYINSNVTMISKVLGYIAKITLATMGVNIIFLQLAYVLISFLKLAFYKFYFRKNYGWIQFQNVLNEDVLKDRNAYIVSEIAWTVFSSTDMIILSVFVSSKMSSVYSVYNLIFQNLSVLLNSVYTLTVYSLSQEFFKDRDHYVKLHDSYNSIFLGLMTAILAVAYQLTIPFVSIYTKGITDVQYIWDRLPLFFCFVQFLSWARYVAGNLTAIAGYAKVTAKISIVEAIINITLSIILVNKFGIVGVIAATACALPIKYIMLTYLSDKVILKRSVSMSAKIFLGNACILLLSIIYGHHIKVEINNVSSFLMFGILYSIVACAVSFLVNVTINPELMPALRRLIKMRKHRNN